MKVYILETMDIKEFLLRNANIISRYVDSGLKMDVEKQEKYLNSFPEPRDLIERSFYQYKCQMKTYGYILWTLINCFSAFVLPLYYLECKMSKKPVLHKKVDAFFNNEERLADIIPDVVKRKYKNLMMSRSKDEQLTDFDLKFIGVVWKRYPISFHFVLKTMIKVSQYSAIVDAYSPDAIIATSEYSFTSSILTKYCREKGITHINVMHGDRYFYMGDSFFSFDECYVWDDYYVKLFRRLRANPNQFIIEIPPSMHFSDQDIAIDMYDFTYYMADESLDEMHSICKALVGLQNEGYKVKIRMHPIWTNKEDAVSIFENIEIEDNRTVSVEKSILSSKRVISLRSTVLIQAVFNGVDIVVDDISSPDRFKQLLKIAPIFMEKEHMLLSDFIMKN